MDVARFNPDSRQPTQEVISCECTFSTSAKILATLEIVTCSWPYQKKINLYVLNSFFSRENVSTMTAHLQRKRTKCCTIKSKEEIEVYSSPFVLLILVNVSFSSYFLLTIRLSHWFNAIGNPTVALSTLTRSRMKNFGIRYEKSRKQNKCVHTFSRVVTVNSLLFGATRAV